MPGYLLHVGATVMCMHAGQAQPTVSNPRVKVSGQPIVTQAAPYVVAGCGLTGTSPPCATAQWIVAATRVLSGGVPSYFCKTARQYARNLEQVLTFFSLK